MKTGILGGGISGLSFAYFLKSDYEILEKNSRCGGLASSFSENGFTFDVSGGHIIFSKDNETLELMKSVLGENIVKNKRNTKILFKNRYIKYPFENGLSDLPKEDNYECLYHYINNPHKENPANFGEWVYHVFGKGIAEKYMIPYNRKIWKFDPFRMSMHWVERIPKPPMEDVIKSSLGIETEGYTHQLFFYYPKLNGTQALVDAFEHKVKNVTKNFEIVSIEKQKNGKWIVKNKNESKEFDRIVNTLPLQDLFKCLKDVPKDVDMAVKNLKYNSLINLCVGIDEPEKTDISWLYVPEEDVLFNRVVYLGNYSKETSPKNKSALIVETTFNEGDEMSKMPEKELTEELINGLHKKKILDKSKVCYTKIFKTKYAYIVFDIDYNKNLKTVLDYLESISIKSTGRFAEYQYINMDQCIMRAKNLAMQING